MKKKLYLSILVFLIFTEFSYSQNLLINEVVSVNNSLIPQNGEYYDWVEIRNTTSASIDISGYHITDDPAVPKKYKLPISTSLIIPANGYIMLFASSSPSLGPLHLSFGLSSDGEQVRLYDAIGTTLLDALIFPKLKQDVSYGKLPDGSLKYFFPASPNQINNIANSYIGILSSPVFSQIGGFYNTDLSISLTSPEQADIIYSVDGTDPLQSNLTLKSFQYKNIYPFFPGQPFGQFNSDTYQAFSYTSPIPIINRTNSPNKTSTKNTGLNHIPPNYNVFKGTVVKAKAYKANYLSSDVSEQSYFVNSTGINPYGLPVISLGIQENKLFDYDNGAYTPGVAMDNYRTQNPNLNDWGTYGIGNYFRDDLELETTFNYIPDKTTEINQNVGVKIHGNMSRHIILKSLRVYARSIYGKDQINFKFFDYIPTTTFKRLILRNSGGDFNYTMFRDGIIQKSVNHLDFETQSYTPAVTFMNGEFWGILNIRERLDDEYYNLKYGFSKDSLDVLENNQIVEYGFNTHFLETLNFIKNNNTSSANNYNQVLQRIDIDNMIDYYTSELYFSNQDWPSNNIQYWRMRKPYDPNSPKGKDGRWRWSMYDMDSTTGSTDMPNPSPSYNNITGFFSSVEDNAKIFTKLFDNQTFKNKFLVRNADLLNTAFKSARIVKMINENKIKLKNTILEHVRRWREPLAFNWTDPVDTTYWASRVNIMVDFINQRPSYYNSFIKSKLNVTGEFQLTLLSEINKGHIKVNTIDIEPNTPGVNQNTYPWTGTYYDGIETKLVAFPKRGYKFSHWLLNGAVNNNTILTFTTNSNTTVEAIFNIYFLSDNPFPLAYDLSKCEYNFTQWSATSTLGTFPPSASFVYFDQLDPNLTAEIENKTNGVYNLTSRTRINGLGANGVSFINTSNATGNPGYPGMKLGGMILAIKTENIDKVSLKWIGRTIVSNSREYKIRLQYRYGDVWPFQDLLDKNGQVIEYTKQANGGSQVFVLDELPPAIMNKDYVQLLWRYYFTGNIANANSDARDQLAIDDIILKNEKYVPELNVLNQILGPSVIKSVELIPLNEQKAYMAKDFIELLPNFNTDAGVVLDASTGECPN